MHVNGEKTWRGGERQTVLLAAALQELGISSGLACRAGSPLEANARSRGVPTIPLPSNPFRAAFIISKAANKYDLIHCHTGRAHGFAAALAPLHKKPIVVTRRVMFLPTHSWFSRYKYQIAKEIVCISSSIYRQLESWGVPAEKLTRIPDAIPAPSLTPDVQELRALLGIAGKRRVVGCIGALTAEKDHATLLRAARQLAAKIDDVHLVVIGDGNLKAELLSLRSELGLDQSVHFSGFIPEAEKFMWAFDVFVLCSKSEGLGSIILDAFACGVPVVATAVGGIPELVSDDNTGLLVPASDPARLASAIEQLLSNPARAKRLTESGRALVEQGFTVNKMAERYISVYEKACAL